MSVFKTNFPRKPQTTFNHPNRPEYASGTSNPLHPAVNDSIAVVMTGPEQVRLEDSRFPHYDALAVANLKNRR